MKIFHIEENDANQRLDKFIKKLLPNSALSLVYKMNRKNQIKINGKRQDNEYKLQTGDEVKIFLKDEEFAMLSERKQESVVEGANKLDTKNIVYEDGHLLIVNKEPGVIVHPGDFKTKEVSLIHQVQDYLGNKLDSLTFRPSLIHRIDKDTSGIIMIAKTKQSLDFMLRELQDNKIEKTYIAVCLGSPEQKEGTIRKKLLRKENAENENKVVVDEKSGQKAVTHYKVLEENVLWKYSVIECRLETGRMHQIRVHLSAIGCPIIGDNTYGDKGENSFAKRTYNISRQLLHAARVSFMHPIKKVRVTFRARLKDDMKQFIQEEK